MLGPTGGYLWAYPVVAFAAGWVAEQGKASFTRNVLAAIGAEIILFVAGISWLAVVTHSWHQAAFLGLYPFVFAEVSKIMIAAATALHLRRSL